VLMTILSKPEANRSRQTPHYGSEQRLDGTPTGSPSRAETVMVILLKFVVMKKPARITGSSNTAPAKWKKCDFVTIIRT
jgi:hypothetical protein